MPVTASLNTYTHTRLPREREREREREIVPATGRQIPVFRRL